MQIGKGVGGALFRALTVALVSLKRRQNKASLAEFYAPRPKWQAEIPSNWLLARLLSTFPATSSLTCSNLDAIRSYLLVYSRN